MSIQKVNEKTSFRVTTTFLDDNNAVATPSSARYRIDCLTNKQQILDWTAIGSLSTQVTINITSDQNAIINDANSEERKELVVESTNASGQASISNVRWDAVNLQGVT